jgi:TolB protein
VTRYQLADQVPDWSPDGKRLAFQARDFDSDFEITVVNADGSGRRRLTRDKFDDTEPAWSPDGRTIAFSSNRDGDFEIFVMNVDGSGAKQLTHNSIDDGEPAWSPDGRTIAFTSLARQRLAVSAACELLGVAEFLGIKVRPSVFRMNADGSAPRRLAQRACGPAWTADGEELGFVSDRAGNSEIYVMGADGLSVRRVTHTPANEHSPDWQR